MGKNQQYLAFARKYRPSNFSELIGQEVLVKILNYSIINDRICHGYLLSGIRGVGKTSSARIIAKTINCENKIKNEHFVSPCNQCKSCENFNLESHPDIIEIDAASSTSVDDVRRDIITGSEYRPLLSKYKIFIIDEVHMLSKNAFNALLKILEEPPQHVIFIFATTEIQKVPLTIISRCQRHDLRRLTFDEIIALLKNVMIKEKLNFDDSALKTIAYKAEGSARDALTILDQAVNLGETLLSEASIHKMLGSTSISIIVQLVTYMIDKDAEKAIGLITDIYSNSGDLEELIAAISDFIAYLTKRKSLKGHIALLYDDFNGQEIIQLLKKTTLAQLSILWQIFTKSIIDIKISHNQLVTMEMVAIKAIYACSLPSPEQLLNFTDEEKPNIINFVQFLLKKREMDIYYSMLNEVEIQEFANNVLKISMKDEIFNQKTKIKESLDKLLFEWTTEKWTVIISKQDQVVSLKEKLLAQIKENENWKLINQIFPDANLEISFKR